MRYAIYIPQNTKYLTIELAMVVYEKIDIKMLYIYKVAVG